MTLLTADDTWPLFALVVAGTALALWMERRFRWAARLSAPVVAMLIAMLLSNARVVPPQAPAFDFIETWLLLPALPLLLMRADVLRIARETGQMLGAFVIASLGTILGAFAAFALVGSRIPEAPKAAGIMAASYIGGMVNFTAVSQSTDAAKSLRTALVVADNFVMAGTFLVLLWVAGSAFFRRKYRLLHPDDAAAGGGLVAPDEKHGPIDVLDLAVSVATACGIVAVAMFLQRGISELVPPAAGDGWFLQTVKTMLVNKFVLITAVSVAAATLFSRQLSGLRTAELLGSYLLYLFLFAIGLPAEFAMILRDGHWLFLLCLIIVAVNLVFTLVVGRFFRLSLEDLLLACNASIGGPPTAAAMAMGKGWDRLVLPGLLAGLFGYCIGTPLGLLVTSLLSR